MAELPFEAFYSQLKISVVQQNFKLTENLITKKSVLDIPSSSDFMKRINSDKNLTDIQKQLIEIAMLTFTAFSAKKEDFISVYENLLTKINDSQIICDDFEFEFFFRFLFKRFRKRLQQYNLISEDHLKTTISIVRNIFVSQKKSKFFRVLPIVLHQLMFLYFGTNQFQQGSIMVDNVKPILDEILENSEKLEVFYINYY